MKKIITISLLSLYFNINATTLPVIPKQKQEISFQENKGQVSDQKGNARPDVLFSGSDGAMNYHLRNNGISYQLYQTISSKKENEYHWLKSSIDENEQQDSTTIYRLDITWINANTKAELKKETPLPSYNNYYLEVCPNGVTGVKSYKKVTYKNLYQGIDLVYYENNGKLEYDFNVQPGTDYKQIQLKIDGATNIIKNQDGSISIKTPLGTINEGTPIVYQNNKQLKANWVLNKNVLSFELENYDLHLPLVIDPITRVWGTYYGGGATEVFRKCDIDDATGDIYVAGDVGSSNIATSGVHQIAFAGNQDGLLVKFTKNGVRLWSTYYGGSQIDRFYGISKLSSTGSIYAAGNTASTSAITSAGCHQLNFAGGNADGMIVKFNSSNGTRQWGTYYGGTLGESITQCCIDASENVYVAGSTFSNSGIVTSGAFGGGNTDGFIVKLNSAGVRQWAKYFGGTGDELFNSCKVDTDNNICLVGYSTSSVAIVTPGAFQSSFGGSTDAIVSKYDNLGNVIWCTYYGGTGGEGFNSCAVDLQNNIYAVGYTSSSSSIATPAAFLTNSALGTGMVVKFNSSGIRQWGTYYGGSGMYDCDINSLESFIVIGNAPSSAVSIATPGAYQTAYTTGGMGPTDAFLVQFNNSGVRQYATYYGGADFDSGLGCAIDNSGDFYGLGFSSSSLGIATAGAHQSLFVGGSDGFLVKFSGACTITTGIGSQNNIGCSGNLTGSATITASGGISYIYSWSSNKGTIATATGLSVGIYSCTVTNDCGAIGVVTVNITQGTSLAATLLTTSVTCNGANTGIITASITSGSSPYTYSWSNGKTTATITGLLAGNYSVTIYDASNCSFTAMTSVIQPATGITYTATGMNEVCGKATAYVYLTNVTGGSTPYTYSWNTGSTTFRSDGPPGTGKHYYLGTSTCVITDANGCTKTSTFVNSNRVGSAVTVTITSNIGASCGSGNGAASVSALGGRFHDVNYTPSALPYIYRWTPSGKTTYSVTGLASGIYTVIVVSKATFSPADSCITLATVNISQSNNLTFNIINNTVSCNGGSDGLAIATSIGGSAPYTYSWSDGQTNQLATNLTIGTYTLFITDSAGCTGSNTVTITEPSALEVTTSPQNILCIGGGTGGATVTALGGTPSYIYSWSNGSSINNATGLSAGSYIVKVTDGNGCTKTATLNVNSNTSLTVNILSTSSVTCNGGSNGGATATITGGTSPYTYSWSNNGTDNSVNNLSAGSYSIKIIDSNGCNDTQTLTIAEPIAIDIVLTAYNITCNQNDGSITSSVNGGIVPYSYYWSNGATNATVSNLSIGNYTLLVIDANACSKIQTVTITAPLAINISMTNKSDTCTQSKGLAIASVSGGTGTYTYLWSNGATNNAADNLSVGNYSVIVTDSNGCTQTTNATINDMNSAISDAGNDVTIEQGESTPLNGSGGIIYKWIPTNGLDDANVSNPIASPIKTTTYTLVITDNNGCTATDDVTITVNVKCSDDIFIPNSFSPNGDGNNDFLFVRNNCIQALSFKVFNRWGEKVFETTDQKIGWDGTYKGKALATGVYAYFIEANLTNNTSYNDKGTISIIK